MRRDLNNKKVFENERNESFTKKLKEIIKGQDHLEKSSVCSARNYLFELVVAARFHKAGYTIEWGGITDVVALKGSRRVLIECKKIVSEKRFEENFNKAGAQLKREIDVKKSLISGLVFIDVSSCLENDLPNREVANADIAQLYLEQAMKMFVKRNSFHIERLNRKYKKESLGLCLYGQSCIWTKDLTQYICTKIDVRTDSNQSDVKFNELKSILSGIENSFADMF